MKNHPTADLARFCAELSGEDVPSIVRERVRYLLLDHLAVTMRGSLLPSSLAAYRMLYIVHATEPHGVTIWGRPERAEAAWAALVNGVASHGLMDSPSCCLRFDAAGRMLLLARTGCLLSWRRRASASVEMTDGREFSANIRYPLGDPTESARLGAARSPFP